MKKIWKRFEEWATALRSNLFTWTRIKLTFLYLLRIIVTLAIYSAALYFALLNNVKHEVVHTVDQAIRHQIFENAIDHIQLQIFIIDLVTFAIAAVGSYWLAGVNLRPIKRVLEAQEAFTSDASHELRTPLAVMKTDIEVLLRSKTAVSPEIQAVLDSNLEEIHKLSSMTSELLDLARGKEKHTEQIAIGSIVEQEVALLQTLAIQKGLTLSSEGNSVRTVHGDKEALSRVFKNIIANAIAYTDTGTITVMIQDSGATTRVTVTDTGTGISKDDLPHVFTRFYKADNSHSTHGSGLGLAIAKHIIERYNGTITIQSVLTRGTTVTIILPSHEQ